MRKRRHFIGYPFGLVLALAGLTSAATFGDPDDAPDGNFDGYKFWLDKLNRFNGDFVQAEMVKAFITLREYRSRFGS